jgi:C4-dicarboxylate-specific signal transduction histidine kinase
MIENAIAPQAYPWSVTKRFLAIFLAAAAVVVGVATTHYSMAMKTERIERETSELLNVQLGSTAIARDLEDVSSDLLFLAQHNELQGKFEKNDLESRSSLAKQFLVFSAQKGKYDQIRLLDHTGMEIVRVNYNDGSPTIVAEDRLQNKAHRYYFEKTWALPPGETYVSPLDLNIERGQIEQPLKPMIRLGTPVSDRSGRKRGVLLFNYFGDRLIGDFRGAAANISDHVMLLNADGYWLSSPRPADEWGFMYGNDRTFAKAHPDSWHRVQADDMGQFYREDGMFSYTTIYPLLHAAGDRRPAGQEGSPVTDKGYYWKAIAHVSPQLLTSAREDFLRQNLLAYSALFALLAIASLLLSRATVRHQQAAAQVEIERRVRGSLEETVEERTQELEDTQAEKDRVVQRLIQAEKMAAIGTMASGIGHEINNPLYAILGMAEAIRDEEDHSRCHGYGLDILTHSKQIAEIVRSLSGYVRPGDEHDSEVVDVNESLAMALSMAKRSLLSDHLQIREDLLPVPGISARSEEIQQAFFNVL